MSHTPKLFLTRAYTQTAVFLTHTEGSVSLQKRAHYSIRWHLTNEVAGADFECTGDREGVGLG